MTGWATVGLAVEAMQFGVSDFVEKPWTNTRLLEILTKQIGLGRERRESRRRAQEEARAREEALLHLQEQEREIAEAKAIQEKLLPREIPQMPGYEIASAWQSARLVDRIVKGTSPAELPFELRIRYEIVVNLKATKAIGFAISDTFLLIADEVIE